MGGVRVGADIGLKCLKCQRRVLLEKCAVPGLDCELSYTYQALNRQNNYSGVIIRNKAYFRFSIGTGSIGSGNGNRKILE
jgi:hypothetical protein